MITAGNIEKLIKEFFKTKESFAATSNGMDKKVLNDALAAFEKSKVDMSADLQPGVWRIIMNKPIAKIAVAAVLLVAAVISITLLNKSSTPAYAIEQTIEAMRSIYSIHAFTTDWDNSKGEAWVQTNPQTGQEEYYCADQNNFLIVGTPQATYYYYKDENLVRIRNEYMPASEIRFSRFFEDLVKWVQQYKGELSFYPEFDQGLQKEIIMVRASIPTQGDMKEKEFIVRVDSETKLPISIEMLKCGPGQGAKSVDSIEYNAAIPEGVFKFKIPDGAKVVYEDKNGRYGEVNSN
jgi:outer membrane lipoprotein-sorting protein